MSLDITLAPWQQRMHDHAAAAIDGGRMGHALLFCGPPMLGKRLVAERLAQRVLCLSTDPAARPCGQCRACVLYHSRSQKDPVEQRPDGSPSHPWGHPGHPDAIFVGHAWRMTPSPPRQLTVVPVDQVRELSTRLSTTPQYGSAKVAIIDPADDMNDAAANALLKTLEEPVPGRYLWLLSANPARLPATIRSRCQRLEFRLPPADEAVAWLRGQGHADAPAAEALAAARGHPGLADAWLRDGGMALRREVAGDMARLAAHTASPLEVAKAWSGDEQALQRLRHAADVARDAAAGLTDPMRIRKLATWFDSANRTRELLRSTIRADLALVDLLLAWRDAAGDTTRGVTR
ncbi:MULTISPECIES: DNA polymerase III subunit delta' [unclassified Luteimonas]|uniref:DNA polymerase III subunit delta' n=1 Tax=unclassified Luteimonas TaxID=2629088 RepID=UPI0018F08EA6|nr:MULTISPECIES: DNA polymerase III subunit delta' [unclassified Luteimonas]MBJ6979574.1 DNA polymerase III subunit delta' [Luteimonas sp. MC1895]MBJ6983140.1 DNA polymerase III subunit delta' [Luteimonas sp. MC1750]QQO05153.1 DNA polymerase III subunit delta' [Luteimonas sp. MC1750]